MHGITAVARFELLERCRACAPSTAARDRRKVDQHLRTLLAAWNIDASTFRFAAGLEQTGRLMQVVCTHLARSPAQPPPTLAHSCYQQKHTHLCKERGTATRASATPLPPTTPLDPCTSQHVFRCSHSAPHVVSPAPVPAHSRRPCDSAAAVLPSAAHRRSPCPRPRAQHSYRPTCLMADEHARLVRPPLRQGLRRHAGNAAGPGERWRRAELRARVTATVEPCLPAMRGVSYGGADSDAGKCVHAGGAEGPLHAADRLGAAARRPHGSRHGVHDFRWDCQGPEGPPDGAVHVSLVRFFAATGKLHSVFELGKECATPGSWTASGPFRRHLSTAPHRPPDRRHQHPELPEQHGQRRQASAAQCVVGLMPAHSCSDRARHLLPLLLLRFKVCRACMPRAAGGGDASAAHPADGQLERHPGARAVPGRHRGPAA